MPSCLFRWHVFTICALSLVSSETPDRNRLSHLYEITNGPLWKNTTHWNSTKPICSWFGVECANGSAEDDTGVTSINLPSNGLAGSVSKIIYEMKDLRTLNLKDNSLTDPGFEGLLRDSRLETIILSGNGFTNINGIGNAPDSLQELHVTHNRIKGSFPVELTKLTKLKNLFLTQNELQGSLPTEIGSMLQLTQLFLYGNNMTGELPSEIGLLGNMEIFTLAENAFTGTIPTTVERMSSLHSFSLHNAALTGTLPLFRNIPFVTEVFLDNNQLEGTIPGQFLENSVILYEHVHVGLSYNNLTGAVPPQLERFTFLELDLVGNQMTVIPDEICQSVIGSWMSGLVEHYGCDAIVCAVGTYNEDGRQSSDENPCVTCPNGTGFPYLGATSCNGETDMSELDIIVDLYVSLRGTAWVQKSGWAEFDDLLSTATSVQPDAVNLCSFHGITCNSNNTVEEIKLSNNGLIGTIPTSIFQLSSLTALDVSRNAVTLTPEGLSALARAGTVSKLHIASTHSIDLTGIGSAYSLRVLDVNGIDFGTPIPSELFNLVDIEEIHARFCYFTEKLPTLIGNLVNLVRLELFNNQLTGSLPTQLGLLSSIQLLDLAENKFAGGIPTEFGLLTRLHKLHLHQSSGAALNGKLPAFDTLPDLVELSLDSNSFSGTIPSNFMAGVSNKIQPILMDLRNNEIIGSIPSELKEFGNLTIYLEGNKIDAIPLDLCNIDAWMNGEVGRVGSCDAILCPTGSWNLYGKASVRESASCLPCTSSTVFGSTSCGSDEDPFPEKTILDSLFKLTGGERYWNSSTGWTDNTLGICFREGITCSDSLSNSSNAGVTEIRLPLNGLGGVIPPSIFKIPNLRVINFSENEVDISFTDIAKATNLEVFRMANTKLKSLAGIDKAPSSLYELDFAENDMSGPIPSELFKLSSVKTLLLGTNHFSGTISSSIAGMLNIMTLDISQNEITGHLPTELGLLTKLSELRLGNNQLSGVLVTAVGRLTDLTTLSLAAQRSSSKLSGGLVAFNTSPILSYLDLSDNAIAGLIPGDFLSGVNLSKNISVNLSGNDITGAVPASLDRFQLLDIDLTGNKIGTLPSDFCDGDNGGWMGGNVELYGCDAIVCRPGTAAEFGRQVDSDSECQSCPGGEQDAPYFGATDCMASGVEAERYILMALYQSLNGENWKEQANWMSNESVCNWYGVTCDNDGAVVSLELKSNNLDSETDISALVFSLPKLATLDLSGNPVPLDFQRIPLDSEITTLILSSTGVKSLDGISFARNLRRLELSNNFIAGTLPDDFFYLVSLESIHLSSNALSGTLPSRLGNLMKLINFYADGNDFSGTIPSELGRLWILENLVLSDNLLSGSIPSELGSLHNLEKFSTHRRSKPGPRLSGTLPAFDNAPLLTDLYLDNNDFQGSIPSNFLSASKLASLVILSHNGLLAGTVPAILDSIPILDLQLEGNRISDFPDEFCLKVNWMNGAIGRVGCDAFLCPPGTANPVGRANDTLECDDCTSPDAAFYYGSTSCDEVFSERKILVLLYQQCGGIEWYRRTGWASDADVCEWIGVSCHVNGDVKSIDLSANNLVGRPPSEIFNLPRLESLILSSNPISFNFDGIKNARRLTELRLDSTGLSSVEGLAGGLGLTDLNLRFNNLQGSIPQEIFALTNLRLLNLANNKLGATLPTRFAELKRLRTLRLGSNEFTGPLPPFSHTFILKTIDLSFNRLSGKIPGTFFNRMSSAAKLEVNLASNMLSGGLPVELARFIDLTLYLRDNNIDDIPELLCNNHRWNGGEVEKFGCHAILCAPGTSNKLGRQSTEETPCMVCDTVYYGSTMCSSAPSRRASTTLPGVIASLLVMVVNWI